ncbi:MAG: MFS transporter [Alphaproteobacteria bacterium]|nr:MFS transporter [Alphaproteobacteria bacterium]
MSEIDSSRAWLRLGIAVAASTVGGVGMWSLAVALPAIQTEFGVGRAEVSFAYTLTMLGFASGGIVMGRLTDRFGVARPVALGMTMLAAGFFLAGHAERLWQFALVQGLLIGPGSAATFSPLVADISLWFRRRRGIAVALVASGNYLAGAFWPPLLQAGIERLGWRPTFWLVAAICALAMVPLALALRRGPPIQLPEASAAGLGGVGAKGFSHNGLMALLVLAGIACCVAMSMPQVHLVAYCVDLGYGSARGAEMLALLLGFGIVSRIASGLISDRVGGFKTLILGSFMQAVALVLYALFDGLAALYAIAILFGLFQGGIVPSYAIIVREYFPPAQAGARVSLVLMATVAGMALGGWLSGALFDLTGSYLAAFAHGVAWNLLNLALAVWLMMRLRRRPA